MIGSSLLIFQLGNNKNELHQVNSWDLAMTHGEDRDQFDKRVTKERKNKKWKPEEIVSDTEVEAICNAKSLAQHKWASDSIRIINISDDPNLYNPMVLIIERVKAEAKKREKAKEELQKYLPELLKLQKAVPEGEIEVDIVTPVRVKVRYRSTEAISNINVSIPNSEKDVMWGHQLIDQTELAKVPEIAALVNCPLRKAFVDRCNELTQFLCLRFDEIQNELYFFSKKEQEEKKKK